MDKLIRKIKAISVKRKSEGEIGFLTEEEDKWFNVKAPEDALDLLLKDVIQKGNCIEFEIELGIPCNFTLKSKAEKKESDGNWADDMTNFEDLLTASHKRGLISINTELISVDIEKKQAIFKAKVKGWIGDEKKAEEGMVGIFTGYGDAEGITNELIIPHFIRMAETRAICRALRWYTNNAKVSIEECDKEKIPKEKIPERNIKEETLTLLKEKDEAFPIENIAKSLKVENNEVDKIVRELLEEGLIYEPRPGYIRYL